MLDFIRPYFRRIPWWVRFQQINGEGWGRAYRRAIVQRKVLSTPPVVTARTGKTEVRVMTWHRDWMNQIWALKSFYHYAAVDYPLYIHDGGLRPANIAALRHHFPRAIIVQDHEAAPKVREALEKLRCPQCWAFRTRHILARKLFDYILLSEADRIISIDSDIVFFQPPGELTGVADHRQPVNRYNKDEAYWYTLPLPELERIIGAPVCPFVNSGLFTIWRSSISFEDVERWLPQMVGDDKDWIVEQTLHALCSSKFGVELLPDTYAVSTRPGIAEQTVCKHYPGYFRYLLYEEGMPHLIRQGFL